jgi:hypothetical protein
MGPSGWYLPTDKEYLAQGLVDPLEHHRSYLDKEDVYQRLERPRLRRMQGEERRSVISHGSLFHDVSKVPVSVPYCHLLFFLFS